MGKLPFETKRELLVRSEEETSGEHGCLPHKRPITDVLKHAFVNIDKPPGPTSHHVSELAKKILGAKKAGHSGTLDPRVSGVFPVFLNSATKLSTALLHAGKEYVCLMHLHEKVQKKDLQSVFKEFTGKLYQTPPVKSVVKRVLRVREVYYIELLETDGKDVLFRVGCEAGTYIRRLCFDIGAALGCGAHMQQLRRSRVGSLNEETLITLQDLTDACHFLKEEEDESYLRKIILPMERALKHMPRIIISDSAVDSLCHGAQLAIPGILKLDSEIKAKNEVAVFTQKGEAVLFGRSLMSSEEMLKAKKGFAVKTERVLMEPGVYPKWEGSQ